MHTTTTHTPSPGGPRILVTGATGQLGHAVMTLLLNHLPPSQIAALVRPGSAAHDRAKSLAQRGVQIRLGDYDDPDTLKQAFAGAERLLFVSSNTFEDRVQQHRHVVEAARAANVRFVAYTSLLHADASPIGFAEDHRQTEALLSASGLNHVVLRNGWYTENHLLNLSAILEAGVLHGAAGDGRIASAARGDYAEAAAAVLLANAWPTAQILELAGDEAYSLTELVNEISRQSGRVVRYQNHPQAAYADLLCGIGLPATVAAAVADAQACVAQGALHTRDRTLSSLIKRPSTRMADSVRLALAKPPSQGQH